MARAASALRKRDKNADDNRDHEDDRRDRDADRDDRRGNRRRDADDAPRDEKRRGRGTKAAVATAAIDEASQRRAYGGFNFGAAFFGWLVATGVGVILTGLLAGAGSTVALSAFDSTKEAVNSAATVGIVSGILLLITLMIAYYAGGYVAGRMSRFDGARQGLGTWLMGIIIAIVLGVLGAVFGAKYNVLQQVHLPHIPVKEGSYTTGGIITLAASIVLTLLAAVSGGKVGERYHRKIDRVGRI